MYFISILKLENIRKKINRNRLLPAYILYLFNVDFSSHSSEMPHPYLKSEVLTKSSEHTKLLLAK